MRLYAITTTSCPGGRTFRIRGASVGGAGPVSADGPRAPRTGTVSPRAEFRPFSIDEQRRILTVGACLTCHKPGSAVMRRSVRDFEALVAARSPACLVPAWK